MPVSIEVIGLKKLQQRFRRFPDKYNQAVKLTLKASLLKIWENVPPYPPKPPESTYDRQGILGKSLGSGMAGGRSQGNPEIFKIVEQGGNIDFAEFGTRLDYAPHVIGENQAGQNSHWWTMKALAKKSKPDIIKLFKTMAKNLARYLDGKGLL